MNTTNSLPKKIGIWSATSIAIGSIIGSGVFMKPASMAAELGSPVWLAIVWVVAGLLSLFGALIYAELGAMLPETGGIYAYFKYMFGEFFAFLFGWAAFAVINTAAVAAIGFICAQYANYFLHLPRFDVAIEQSYTLHIPFIGDLHPLENMGVKVLAIFLVILFSFLNYRSLKAGSYFQVLSTIVKIAVIGLLIIGIFSSNNGSVQNFWHAENPKHGADLLSGFVIAMTGAFFAFDGWINVNYIAGEIKDPQRNIPRSLVAGVLACIVVYLLVNQAYLYALPVEKVASSSLVASDAINVAMGQTGSAIVAALIVICTLGAMNGNIMATCRITYAMGKDKIFLPFVGKLHPRFQTPGNAVWLHAAWTSLLIFSGSFDMLADMFVFITWIAYGAGAIGIFLLRKRMPDKPRPYKMWGYPVVPVIFIAFTFFYLVLTVYNDTVNYLSGKQPVINSLLGLLITLIGIPFYFYYRKREPAIVNR